MPGRSKEPLYTPTFWLVSLAHLLLAVSILSIPPVLSVFVRSLDGDEVAIGAVYSAAIFSGLLLRPVTGWILDRLGRRWAFLLGGVLTALCFPIYNGITHLGWELFALRVLHGVGMGALFPTLFTYASDISPASRRTEGLAVFGAVGLLAIATGPVLGEWLVTNWGFGAYNWTMAGLAFAGLVVSLCCKETRPAGGSGAGGGWAAWRYALAHRPLRAIWSVSGVWGIVLGAYFAFLEPLCTARGVPSVSHFFLPYGLSAVALRLVGGGVPDRVGPARLLLPSLLLQGAGVLVLGLAHTRQWMWVAGMLAGMGHGYVFPILNALVVDRCAADRRGVVVTLYTIMIEIGSLIFTPLVGYVVKTWGYRPPFLIGAGLLALVGLLFVVWDPRLVHRSGAAEQPHVVPEADKQLA